MSHPGNFRFLRPLWGLFSVFVLVASLSAQPQGGGNVPEVIRNARELTRNGNLEGALELYLGELRTNPNSAPALNGAGVVLDLLGRTQEARVHFQKLIDLATTNPQKVSAYRGMAMSYAFDNNCLKTTEYEELALQVHVADGDAYNQGERANEAARVCIEAGSFDEAEKLYRRGTELGLKEANIKPERVALWNFRLEHALARLAARRGKAQEAEAHIAKAKAILDQNPEMAKDQMQFLPYLTGYVALWTGKYDLALAELAKASQNDPFIQCLIAQAHEGKGDKASARAWYEKAAKTTNHNPPAAFARPFATRKLKSL
jgi:tetratricopeptide (TPR) repeat protein